ncbi:hypothetical protein C1645_749627 [Glomus cerebriforme]|uniref:Uncharacterized protein n=1 Tax=Glomus cerebriforme TaxID=658196 RepID=A0A397TJZ6_9GLOM|nr:hypothetical protein C1645_749627 [Glomus cerebriforme]
MICQERQNFYNGLPELQFLPEQSNKDFEHKHDMIDSSMIPEVHNELSGDLQSAEHIFTKDNEIHLADDNLPLSPSCEQINVTEIEDSPDNNELIKNQPLTGEQIIEDTENASTSQEEPHSNESITESIKCEVVLPTSSKGEQQLTRPASIIITRSMIASLNLKVCFEFILFG